MTWTVFWPCGMSTRFSITKPSTSVAPDRQARSSRNSRRCSVAIGRVGPGNFVFVAEPQHAAIGEADALEQVVEHHHAPERRRQRRDEQAVVAPRHDAGHGAGGVAAEAVGHQPLAARHRARSAGASSGVGDRAGQFSRCDSSSFCSLGNGTATSSTAASPGRCHSPCGSKRRRAAGRRSATASLLTTTSPSRQPAGGASSGSGAGRRDRGRSRD